MPITDQDQTEMRQSLTKLSQSLHSFAQSPETFRIISSIPSSTTTQPTNLYVLDSSFNPPTLAHLRLATSALNSSPPKTTRRLVLLLATQNADKAAKPASFPHRLVMMQLFAQDLLHQFNAQRSTNLTKPRNSEDPQNGPSSDDGGGRDVELESESESEERQPPTIDIAITKHPYFINKATSISNSPSYSYPSPHPPPQQIHLIGYDTLLRLFDPKYYPPNHTLDPLTPFLSHHKLRVTLRTDDAWGDRSAQKAYIQGIGEGSLEGIGGKREWGGRIEVVEGKMEGGGEEEEVVVSSTKVRNAVKRGDVGALKGLVTEGVRKWISKEKLYVDD